MSYFPRAARLAVVLTVTGAALVVPATASATTVSVALAPGPSAVAAAARTPLQRFRATQARLRADKRVPKRARIVFDKNWRNPFDSRIHFRVWAKPGKRWVPIESRTWRAGSGLGGRAGKDSCRRNRGWLPNDTYTFVQHDRRKAPMINGRTFELEDKVCRNGTRRQLLFIHTEQTWWNTQCRDRGGDDRCRWEPEFNDYRSYGCIKMAPGDLRALTRRFHAYFRAGVRYRPGVVAVRVKD